MRVKKTSDGKASYYPFPHYEVHDGTVVKYYFFGGMRVAQRRDGVLTYLHGNHLGSTVLATDVIGGAPTALTYHAYGSQRLGSNVPTDHKFTNQKYDSSTGLYYYGARYYDPALGTFVSPDSIVPSASHVFGYNRFMYGYGNPLKFTDPDGHDPTGPLLDTDGPGAFDVVMYIVEFEMKRNLNSAPAQSIAANMERSGNAVNVASVNEDNVFGITSLIEAGLNRAAAYVEWAQQVGPGAVWDHKTPIRRLFTQPGVILPLREHVIKGQVYTSDTWSNIHYGYVGKAIGFTDEELLYGAGTAQLLHEAVQGFPNQQYNQYLMSGDAFETYFDNGNDPAFIQFGIYLWDKYGSSLTRNVFLEELSASGLSTGEAE